MSAKTKAPPCLDLLRYSLVVVWLATAFVSVWELHGQSLDLLAKLPRPWGARLVRMGFNLHPAFRSTGGRVVHVAPDLRHIRVRLPLTWKTKNIVGSLYGGSLFAITDGAHPAMLMAALGEDYIIGVSAHNPAEAKAALQSGADYLGCGAVFGTATKADVKKLGTEGLEAICKAKGLPVVGIGGVTADNYREVRAAGADGAAIVSGILAQPDISATVRAIAKVSQEFAK